MLRRQVLLIGFLLMAWWTPLVIAQPAKLSASSQISLITCGPWDAELYSAFGHSAIRVYDPVANIDWAFNYGTFDFNQPNFYLNFARGKNLYMLSVQDYGAFRDYYISNNRYIHEQILRLNGLQRQRLFEYLWNNAQPENRNYPYDYFYDNCSTRPRDVLMAVFGDSLTFSNELQPKGLTIRQLTDLYLSRQPWGDLGIDLCLGLPMDKMATVQEEMFLPDFLEFGMDQALINTAEGKKSFVQEKIIVHESTGSTSSGVTLFHPWMVFGSIGFLLALISVFDYQRKRLSKGIDALLFVVTGSLGLLLLLLWLATDHRAAAWNYNLFWAMPLNLFLPFFLGPKGLTIYFKTMTLLLLAVLGFWVWLPQQLNIFLTPLIVGLAVRYAVFFNLINHPNQAHTQS